MPAKLLREQGHRLIYRNLVNSNDNSNDADADGKTICTKLAMETVKRDVSGVESSYEL